MSISNEDSLHLLIHSLGKAEKRHFKLYSRRHVIGKENTYVLLFNAMERQRVYDEKLLKKDQRFRDFAPLKNRLRKAILRSLEQYHTSIRMELRNTLNQAEILVARSLFGLAIKIINKAKPVAVRHELPEEWLELLRLEFNIAVKNTEWNARTRILEEEKKAISLLEDQKKYRDLSSRFAAMKYKAGEGEVSRLTEKMAALLRSENLRDETLPLSMAARQNFLDCHFHFHLLKENYHAAYIYAKKKVDLYHTHPHFIELNPSYYLTLINNFLVACTGTGIEKEMVRYLHQLHKMRKGLKAPADRGVAYFYSYHLLNLYINNGSFEGASKELLWIESEFSSQEKNMNRLQKIILCATIAQVYFGNEQFKKSLYWLKKSMSFGEEKVRTDIECFIRIFYLLIHVENKADRNFLMSVHRSALGFLKKNKRLFEFERTIMQFIKKHLLQRSPAGDLKEHFMKLKKELAEISKEKTEKHSENYFDFTSWVESKIEKKSFAWVVRKNNFRRIKPYRTRVTLPSLKTSVPLASNALQ